MFNLLRMGYGVLWRRVSESSKRAALGSDDVSGGHVKGQQYREFAAASYDAAYFDAAMMIFHDAVSQRESEAGAIALGRVERPEDVGQVLRRDAASGVADHHAGITILRIDLDADLARDRPRPGLRLAAGSEAPGGSDRCHAPPQADRGAFCSSILMGRESTC